MKRLLDIIGSLLLLILLSPLLIGIALWIKFTSKGPIIYKQTRVGLQGKLFKINKFRSMVANADQIGSYQTSHNDQRITNIGKLLRKTSLDELPQLINVLKSEMSFVGPRPDVPAQEKDYTEKEWQQRHRVRPGITGWAQATLRSSATPEQRKQLDLAYIENCSLWLDFKILLLTVRQILIKGGN